MARRSTRRTDWGSKNWYRLVGPEEFGEPDIGETVSDEPDKLVGRKMEMTYDKLSGDMSKQNTKVKFEIKEIVNERAFTKFVGHELTRDYIGSLVKRRTSRIDATQDVLTKDGYKVRVKPVLFTTRQCKSSHKKEIRAKMSEVVRKKAKELPFEDFVETLVDGTLASEIYQAARDIYPLRRAEIRKSEVLAEPEEVEEIPEGFEEVAEEAGLEA